uniref:Uncharacterized protein n=1 Tax=Oryza punctata TaxID=4537 RepID=A0A0E0JL64_ORYPU
MAREEGHEGAATGGGDRGLELAEDNNHHRGPAELSVLLFDYSEDPTMTIGLEGVMDLTMNSNKKDMKLNGSLCSLPKNSAFELSVAAIAFLFVAQLVGTMAVATTMCAASKCTKSSTTRCRATSIAILQHADTACASASWPLLRLPPLRPSPSLICAIARYSGPTILGSRDAKRPPKLVARGWPSLITGQIANWEDPTSTLGLLCIDSAPPDLLSVAPSSGDYRKRIPCWDVEATSIVGSPASLHASL